MHHSILGLGDVGGVVLDGAAHDADNSSNGSVQPAEASTSVYTVARDVAAQSRCGGDDDLASRRRFAQAASFRYPVAFAAPTPNGSDAETTGVSFPGNAAGPGA